MDRNYTKVGVRLRDRARAASLLGAGGAGAITPQGGRFLIPWYALFPSWVDLFGQPVPLIMLLTFMATSAVLLLASARPAAWVAGKNITEVLRSDDF